jgi:hypothetical protein
LINKKTNFVLKRIVKGNAVQMKDELKNKMEGEKFSRIDR